jgi:MFS family permease
MLDSIIHEIQVAVAQLSWHGLLGIGIACAFAGLIIWLTGMAMARVATAAVGGFAGCFVFYVYFSHTIQLLAVGALAGVAVGLMFEVILAYVVGFATGAYNIILATLTAAAGSVLLLLGAAFLLSLKNTNAFSHVSNHRKVYLTIILAMLVFGTFEQLIFCRKKHKVIINKKQDEPATEVKPIEKNAWRTK